MIISRDAILFFMVEVRNVGGVLPATLGSAYDSYQQTYAAILLDWCGYKKSYCYTMMIRFDRELGKEIRKLIRKYGKKKELETIIGR